MCIDHFCYGVAVSAAREQCQQNEEFEISLQDLACNGHVLAWYGHFTSNVQVSKIFHSNAYWTLFLVSIYCRIERRSGA